MSTRCSQLRRALRPRLSLRPTLLSAAAVTAVLMTGGRSDAIDFSFVFADPAGQGFNNPTNGPQMQAALLDAGDLLGRIIQSTYIGETISLSVTSNPQTNTSLLAQTSLVSFYSNFPTSDARFQSDTAYTKALASSLAGHDMGSGFDATLSVNTAQNFYFGTDGATPGNQEDFVSVAMHELVHALGFSASFQQQGGYGRRADGSVTSNTDLSGFPLIYDRFVSYGGIPVISLSTPGDRANALVSNDLFWSGPNANLGNNGSAPKLYAPSTFAPGTSVSHLDQATFPNDDQGPSINAGVVHQNVSPVVRGILRDMGWNVAISASNATFTAAGGDNLASNHANWSQTPLPGDTLLFPSNSPGTYNVSMDANYPSLGGITFPAGAPSYILRFRSYTDMALDGTGVTNPSAAAHTIVLETYTDDLANNTVNASTIGAAAHLIFRNNAVAGSNVTYLVHAGFTAEHSAPNLPPSYDRYNGSRIDFYNSSTAGTATFLAQGAQGDGAPNTYAGITFHDNSAAGQANITNQQGRLGYGIPTNVPGFGAQTNFMDASSAAGATIANLGQDVGGGGTGGITNFRNTSTAGIAVIDNYGASANNGLGGVTQFRETASAGSATITNHDSPYNLSWGATTFFDSSTANHATLNNLGGSGGFSWGGVTDFRNTSNAGSGTFNNQGTNVFAAVGGRTRFYDDSSAGSGTFHNLSGSSAGGGTEFYDRATAGNATLILDTPAAGQNAGSITFRNNSSAGSANITSQLDAAGTLEFHDSATAANANVVLAPGSRTYMRMFDASSGGSATFRVAGGAQLQFYNATSAASAHIYVDPSGSLSFAGDNVTGNPTTTAGNARVELYGASSTGLLAFGGQANFAAWSTAGNATFDVDGGTIDGARGAILSFANGAHGGNALIFLHAGQTPNAGGGEVHFGGGATGDSARIVSETGAVLDFTGNRFSAGTVLGSIAGAGNVLLNGSALTVGSLGLSDTITGGLLDAQGYSGGSITKVGTGTLTLAGANNYGGLTTVSQGNLRLSGSNALAGDYAVAAGATLEFDAAHAVGALSGAGATVVSAPVTAKTLALQSLTLHAPLKLLAGSGPSTLASLSVDPGVSLDLTNNPLTLKATSSDAVRQLILANTLTSSIPDPSALTSLGYLPAAIPPTPIAPADVTVRLTYTGDANLDGKINADDYALLDKGYAQHLFGWEFGDFNYDGQVTSADYLLIDRDFTLQGNPLSPEFLAARAAQFGSSYVSELMASVPEPLSTAWAAVAAIGLLARRRRTAS